MELNAQDDIVELSNDEVENVNGALAPLIIGLAAFDAFLIYRAHYM